MYARTTARPRTRQLYQGGETDRESRFGRDEAESEPQLGSATLRARRGAAPPPLRGAAPLLAPRRPTSRGTGTAAPGTPARGGRSARNQRGLPVCTSHHGRSIEGSFGRPRQAQRGRVGGPPADCSFAPHYDSASSGRHRRAISLGDHDAVSVALPDLARSRQTGQQQPPSDGEHYQHHHLPPNLLARANVAVRAALRPSSASIHMPLPASPGLRPVSAAGARRWSRKLRPG